MKGREISTVQGMFRSNYRDDQLPPHDVLKGDNIIAQKTLGKAKVSLCLQEDQSLWGLYKQQDAAILQFLATRNEPPGYKLCWLEIRITFSEQDPSQALSGNPLVPDERVWILVRPSPRLIKGGELMKNRQKDWKAEPNIDTGAGPALSFGNYGESSKWEDKKYWRYESSWEALHQRSTIATWQWTANKFNEANEDLKDMYAGVVLSHAKQPFYVSCEIEGKLLNMTKRGWYKLSRPKGNVPLFFKVNPVAREVDIDQSVHELEQRIQELTKRALASKYKDNGRRTNLTWMNSYVSVKGFRGYVI